MSRPAGWKWNPVPQRLIKEDTYLDFATPVNPGSLLDRLFAFAVDRYGIFPAGFRALRARSGLEGSPAEFESALAALETAGYVFRWTSPAGVLRGILANYSAEHGIPASLFRGRPDLEPDACPPSAIADVCGWVPPGEVADNPEVSHDKPTRISRGDRETVAIASRETRDASSRVETETETETELLTRAHTRDPSGQATAPATSPDLPEADEALVADVLAAVCTRMAEHARGTLAGLAPDACWAWASANVGPSLRGMARSSPAAFRAQVPKFLAGHSEKLGKADTANCVAYLRQMVDQWTPDQDVSAKAGHGRDPRHDEVPASEFVYAKPSEMPYWEPGWKPTKEQIAKGMGMTVAELEAADEALKTEDGASKAEVQPEARQ